MERAPQKILITGYIGFGNAGDEAIAQVVTGQLRELLPGVEITVVSGNPAHTAEAYGVRAIGWREPLAIAEAVRTADLAIVGGGGLFQDYWGFDPNAILTREHWGLSFYVAPALLAAVYGKPLMLYAVGAGPLFSEHGHKYTKVAGDIASRITVRDLATRNLFESLGVSAEKIAVTADPGFDLAPDLEAADIPEAREWKSEGPAVAVCVRSWGFGTDQTFCEGQIAAALDDFLAGEGGRLLFVPFHVDPAANDDVAAARRVVALLRHRGKAGLLTEACSPRKIAGIIAKADLVLGMRLHSLIFSLAAEVPFIALEYDPKVAGLTALAGFEEFTIPLGAIESDVLAARMRGALHGKERFREAAGPRVRELRSRARENAAVAVSLLGARVPADYGADARVLIGRLLMAQITASEGLIERLQGCRSEADPAAAPVRPFEMADSLVRTVKDFRTRQEETGRQLAELGESLAAARKQLEEERRAFTRQLEDEAAVRRRLEEVNLGLAREIGTAAEDRGRLEEEKVSLTRRLEDALAAQSRLEAEHQSVLARKQESDSRLAALAVRAKALEGQLAPHEAKTLSGITKRALQLILDLFQKLTPEPLRAVVRKYYLNGFYFRIFPEKRTGGR